MRHCEQAHKAAAERNEVLQPCKDTPTEVFVETTPMCSPHCLLQPLVPVMTVINAALGHEVDPTKIS